MSEGDLKYGGYNYRVARPKASVYYSADGRHMDKWFNGEDYDPKTKIHHLAYALASIAVLIDAVEQGSLDDDRPPRQGSGLYARIERDVARLQRLYPRRHARYENRSPRPR